MSSGEYLDSATENYAIDLLRDTKRRVSKLKISHQTRPSLPEERVDIRKKLLDKVKLSNKVAKVATRNSQSVSSVQKTQTGSKLGPSKSQSSHIKSSSGITKSVSSGSIKSKSASDLTRLKNSKLLDKNRNTLVKKFDNKSSKTVVLNKNKLLTSAQVNTKQEPRKPKFKRRPVATNSAPTLSFADLLKLADQNKNKVEEEKVEPEVKKKPETGRPLTQEEKDRKAYINSKEYQQWLKSGKMEKFQKEPIPKQNKMSEKPRAHISISEHNRKIKGNIVITSKGACLVNNVSNSKESDDTRKVHTPKSQNISISEHNKQIKGSVVVTNKGACLVNNVPRSKDREDEKKVNTHKSQPINGKLGNSVASAQVRTPSHHAIKQTQGNKSGAAQDRQSTGAHRVPKGARNDERNTVLTHKPNTEQVTSSNPWDRIMGKIKDNRPVKRQSPEQYSDEEDEYDSDDDFICDDAIDDQSSLNNYSSHIRDIFGYDKHRYKDESEADIRGMETSYREQMKEESNSAKLGLKEDLEDMRMEELEKQRKRVKKTTEMKSSKKMKR